MQRVQRKLGRFLPRTPNEADVEGMLRDFADSDKMLEKVCLPSCCYVDPGADCRAD